VFGFIGLGFFLWHRRDIKQKKRGRGGDPMRESIINPDEDDD